MANAAATKRRPSKRSAGGFRYEPVPTPIGEIRPSAYNPRKTDPKRLEVIELSLRKLGFLIPIYADVSGEVISGHQRLLVCERIGVEQVPVVRTKTMDLPGRQGLNIVFNRATNDMRADTTPAEITEKLLAADPFALAEGIPDKDPSSDEFFRCLAVEWVRLEDLLRANRREGFNKDLYPFKAARTLRRGGVECPVVAGPDLRVVNGIGRIFAWAEDRIERVPVVRIPEEEVEFADLCLNLLSMDFDVHTRYREVLRYNSFRRARGSRYLAGTCFRFASVGVEVPLDLTKPDHYRRWVAVHGRNVVDFGAGKMHDTAKLRQAGIRVAAFDPYHIPDGAPEVPDRDVNRKVARDFLDEIRTGEDYTSVFLQAVLNSVPFEGDRIKVLALVAALCTQRTKLYSTAVSTESSWYLNNLKPKVNQRNASGSSFILDYEPRTAIGDLERHPKVQRFFRAEEFRALFERFFREVRVTVKAATVRAIAWDPKPIEPNLLREAIEFEFDLPYPDGTRMGMVKEALEAFSKRLENIL